MVAETPAFWCKYRGRVDPQAPALTAYTYAATFYTANNPDIELFAGTFTVYGPPQLNKNDFVEINWSRMLGLTKVAITKNGVDFYATNGASSGFRDEGQFNVVNGGVLNQ